MILRKQKCLPNFDEVSEYVNIWTIVIVKILLKCCRLRFKYCNPIRINEENLTILSVFRDWLESWNGIF